MGYYDEEDELDKDITDPEAHRLSLFDSLKKKFSMKKEKPTSHSEDENPYGSYMASDEQPSSHDPSVVKHARVETRNFAWWEILILLLEVFLIVYTILTFIFPGLLF